MSEPGNPIRITELRAWAGYKRGWLPLGPEVVLAFADAIQHAYRGGAEDDPAVNGNALCLVCRTWSARGENNHAGDCPGAAFDFGSEADKPHDGNER